MNPDNGEAEVGAGQAEPLPDGTNPVEPVFGNPVIWKIIGSYLNFGDLKACRLVNSEFHGMVMKDANFLQRTLVSLKPYQITRHQFGSTREPWKNPLLKFENLGGRGSSSDVCFDPEELEWLYPLLSDVESLNLRMEKGRTGAGFHPLLKRILKAPKNLQALALEPIFLTDKKTKNFDVWEDALENLEEFEILEPPLGWMYYGYIKLNAWREFIQVVGKMGKIRVLKSNIYVLPPITMEEVALTPPEHFRLNSELLMLSDVLETIAPANRKNLKHVTLGGSGYWDLYIDEEEDDNVETEALICFPSLESATFVGFDNRPRIVTQFILALPMLKELEFSVTRDLPIAVLNAIAERSDCLRKLKLKSSSFQDANWQFLQKTDLSEFQLELIDLTKQETLPDEALNCLPFTIRKLFLRGSLESNPNLALARLNPALVTHLTCIDSGNCFTDDTMKLIIENFQMLRKLNVTNAKRLTDAGFVGSASESGSLSGIKGLRTLILRECGSITDVTLNEIRFLELHYLDLCHNKRLTQEGYEGLLRTNPSLQTLLMSCKSIFQRKEQMYASHSRLSSVVYRRLKL